MIILQPTAKTELSSSKSISTRKEIEQNGLNENIDGKNNNNEDVDNDKGQKKIQKSSPSSSNMRFTHGRR
ncbi:hypothetical protein Glove_83g92 [Diversispora epigaea]|uniref:Uncharacterized protein n=1 Tax=Diversispora epigaea TaxID=1348612 RepID=A0A397JHA6_9GLOM|nr:hypothetical protein Glove_83g92 [Diversispora epigaea]